MEQWEGWKDVVTPELAAFIAERNTWFIATVNSETLWQLRVAQVRVYFLINSLGYRKLPNA